MTGMNQMRLYLTPEELKAVDDELVETAAHALRRPPDAEPGPARGRRARRDPDDRLPRMSRDTRVFLTGQSLSLLGDTALWLALGLWAKDLTGSSSAAGLVILCIVAPQLASPFAGALVDRVRRRTLLLAVNPLTALAILPLLAVHDAGDVWIIYAVATVYGASYVVLAAGQSALLHALVPADQLAKANATLQTVREALRLVTPLAGAGLYTLAGGAAVAILDAATFLLATAALLALKIREPKPEPHADPGITAGARHVARTPGPEPHGRRLRAVHARDRLQRDAAVRAPARSSASRTRSSAS